MPNTTGPKNRREIVVNKAALMRTPKRGGRGGEEAKNTEGH